MPTSNLRVEEQQTRAMYFQKIIENIQDYSIIFLNAKGKIQRWNKGALNIKGYTQDEVIGKDISIFYLPEDIENKLPWKLLETASAEGRVTHEGWRLRKDGSMFWGNTVITALYDNDRNVIGFAKVTRDFTDRKLIEDELKVTSKKLEEKNAELQVSNQDLERFAYIASHDLQEPLRKILTYVSLIKEPGDHKEKEKYFVKIEDAANRMSSLVRDVLNYSRLTSHHENELEGVDLNRIIDQVRADFEITIREKNATIRTVQLPVINGIHFQLVQLFSNLISNALKFSELSPVIDIQATQLLKEEKSRFPQLKNERSYVKITFCDNGIGFDQRHAEQIFNIFQRLNNRNAYQGTGIGLAICKKIVEHHHGVIYATSEAGKGATFTVILPARESCLG